MPRMVQCVKFGRELPGLEKPPFPGELGQRIYDNVSQEAWDMWPGQSTIIINHYSLSMADPEARKLLRREMEDFFFGDDARKLPSSKGTPIYGGGAKGASSKGGAARRK